MVSICTYNKETTVLLVGFRSYSSFEYQVLEILISSNRLCIRLCLVLLTGYPKSCIQQTVITSYFLFGLSTWSVCYIFYTIHSIMVHWAELTSFLSMYVSIYLCMSFGMISRFSGGTNSTVARMFGLMLVTCNICCI